MKKPTVQNKIIDFSETRKLCEEYVEYLDTSTFINGVETDSFETEIFEKVFEAFFGKDVFEWVNGKFV